MNEPTTRDQLSDQGRARRDSILAAAKRRVRARRHRRQALLGAASVAPVLALTLIMLWPARLRAPTAPPPAQPRELVRTEPATPTLSNVAFEVVRTRTDLEVTRVSDAQLLELLHQAGHTSAGLARLPGRVVLTGDPITPQRAPEHDPDAPPPGSGV